MYNEFFNFKEIPFALSPDPSFLYLSKSHRMALTMLEYGLTSRAPISVITGEVGCGKTTLLRQVLTSVPADVTVGMVTQTNESFRELLQWVAAAFNISIGKKTGVALYQEFIEFVQSEFAEGRHVVLIVDEAQNMSVKALEGLRMLSNINVGKDLVLQTILVGQPELLDTMRLPEMRQLAQRVSVDYHLAPLSSEETGRYIRHRLTVAGGDAELFEDAACDLIYNYTGGIPRLVNTMCDMSLVYAFAEGTSRIGVDQVEAVAKDRQVGGILPIRLNSDRPSDSDPDHQKPAAGADPQSEIVGSGSTGTLPLDKQIYRLLQNSAGDLDGWIEIAIAQEKPSRSKRLYRLLTDRLKTNPEHAGLLLARALTLAVNGTDGEADCVKALFKSLRLIATDINLVPKDFETVVTRLAEYCGASCEPLAAPLALVLCRLAEEELLPDTLSPRALCRSNLLPGELAEAVVATYACADAVDQISDAVTNTMNRWTSVAGTKLIEAVK